KDLNKVFVFQLHPSDINSCPQYLVIARFIIPPNLQSADAYGQFFWTMLPDSTSYCGEKKEEVLLSYGLYFQPNTLKDLHSEALSRTQHMKIRSEEMNNFFVGYRQLSEEELDLYDKNNR
ncbi:unnamed protein product, partial [Hymenolepis diminuta]